MQCRCLFFLLLTLFAGLSYAQNPVLVLDLSATTVTAGEQLIANCTATTTTASRVLYVNDESVVDQITGGRLTTISDPDSMTTTWIIDSVQREDAGEYYCFAGGDQASHDDSPAQNVTVYFSPDATVVVPAANVVSGGKAEVVISVEALPGVTDVQVTPPSAQAGNFSHNAVGVTSGNVTLTFPSVNRYYNGMYTASVTNDVGSGTVDFVLTVYFGPYFSYDGKEQENGASIVMAFAGGQDVSIVCHVSATNPVVSDLMLTKPNVDNVEFDEGTGRITITGATAANEGTYTCTAANGKTTSTTINFVLRMDLPPPSGSTPTPTTDSAGNLLATVSVAVVMLLATIFLS